MSQAIGAARQVVAALQAGGVQTVVLAPGSRSAPLAYALAASDMQVMVRIDERAAAFSALGAALITGAPAAVITTSGTAVANLHPALAEADAAGIALLAITADRPRELWGTGANQTTHQLGMFATVVRKTVQVDVGECDVARRISEAICVARGNGVGGGELPPAPGPVHVNISFAPPLQPQPSQQQSPPVVPAPPPSSPQPAGMGHSALVSWLGQLERPVVVAGDKADRLTGLAAALSAAGVPVLAEPSSGLRHLPVAIDDYHARLGELHDRIANVVVVGHPTLTRDITALISRTDLPQWVLTNCANYVHLAPHAKPVHVQIDAPARAEGAAWHANAWLRAWQRRGSRELPAANSLDGYALQVWQASVDTVLLVGASSTIRALDHFAPSGKPTARVYANRGLAGIDGTIATAWGMAVASGAFVRVLCGDLTFLHDANALNAGVTEQIPQLQIIVLDDHGGSIFNRLEHGEIARENARAATRFARFFTTAQRSDIASVARGFGAATTVVQSTWELERQLQSPPAGLSVVHVKISSQHSGS